MFSSPAAFNSSGFQKQLFIAVLCHDCGKPIVQTTSHKVPGSVAPVYCRHPQLLTATVFFLFVIFCNCMNPLCSLGHHSPFICFSFEYMIPYIIYVNEWPNLWSNFALNVKKILYLLKKKKKEAT